MVKARLQSTGSDLCVVLNDQNVVLGVVRPKALEAAADGTVESVMNPGPATYRPDVSVRDLLEVMRARDLHGSSLVTTSRGILMGTVSRDRAERAIAGSNDPAPSPGSA